MGAGGAPAADGGPTVGAGGPEREPVQQEAPAAAMPAPAEAARVPAPFLPFKVSKVEELKERGLLRQKGAIKRVAAAMLKVLLEVRWRWQFANSEWVPAPP